MDHRNSRCGMWRQSLGLNDFLGDVPTRAAPFQTLRVFVACLGNCVAAFPRCSSRDFVRGNAKPLARFCVCLLIGKTSVPSAQHKSPASPIAAWSRSHASRLEGSSFGAVYFACQAPACRLASSIAKRATFRDQIPIDSVLRLKFSSCSLAIQFRFVCAAPWLENLLQIYCFSISNPGGFENQFANCTRQCFRVQAL